VKKPCDNLIVRLWSHDKLIARFLSKCDLTVCIVSLVRLGLVGLVIRTLDSSGQLNDDCQ
jgi:hypothetical protein